MSNILYIGLQVEPSVYSYLCTKVTFSLKDAFYINTAVFLRVSFSPCGTTRILPDECLCLFIETKGQIVQYPEGDVLVAYSRLLERSLDRIRKELAANNYV